MAIGTVNHLLGEQKQKHLTQRRKTDEGAKKSNESFFAVFAPWRLYLEIVSSQLVVAPSSRSGLGRNTENTAQACATHFFPYVRLPPSLRVRKT